MKSFFIVSSLFILLVVGCNRTYNSTEFGLTVTGKVGEIMVVCEPGIWNSDVKAHLDTNLTRFIMPYFPDVTTFELQQKTLSAFEKGNKRYRNLMFVSIDPTAKEPRIIKEYHSYAADQLLVRIIATNYNELVDIVKNQLDEVHAAFDEMEWKRIMKRHKSTKNEQLSITFRKQFGIDMALPKGSQIVTKRPNFYRVEIPTDTKPIEFKGDGDGEGTSFIQSGIMIYQYDFTDSSQFDLARLLQARDTMLKYNVPHEIPGAYMGTQYNKIVAPEGNFTKTADGKLAVYEMRGMFKFVGSIKHGSGGAFWSYHFLHPSRKKVICVSGYVDAPSMTSWTLPLREVQSVLKSIELD
jgi:hypothetical protein